MKRDAEKDQTRMQDLRMGGGNRSSVNSNETTG